jgi:hypothetical protein
MEKIVSKKPKCYFSTDISETLSCCKDGNFDDYGFAKNICPLYPCENYKQIKREIENHEQGN